jgi:hypothetical protein
VGESVAMRLRLAGVKPNSEAIRCLYRKLDIGDEGRRERLVM